MDRMERQLAVGARRILVAKLALQRGLPAGYIHDPAVAMLLSLFVDHLEGAVPTCRSVYAVVDYVPATVASRWLRALEADGLIAPLGAALPDTVVSLTDRGIAIMRDTVIAVGRAEQQVRDDAASLADGTVTHGRRRGV